MKLEELLFEFQCDHEQEDEADVASVLCLVLAAMRRRELAAWRAGVLAVATKGGEVAAKMDHHPDGARRNEALHSLLGTIGPLLDNGPKEENPT